MDREVCLVLVRALTEEVIGAACPDRMPDFAGEFTDFALRAGVLQVAERLSQPRPPGPGLETTLVAGMFFEVLMDASSLPAVPRERVSFVRKKAKDYLVTRLAGQISLPQFYRLLNLIEEKVSFYFEHLSSDWLGPSRPREAVPPPAPDPPGIDATALRQALVRLDLSLKGKRKLTLETLSDFLCCTGGLWFKLLEFETRFQVNKKTAWGYLNLLLHEGILEHNGEKANRVRYALAPPFKTNPSNSTEA